MVFHMGAKKNNNASLILTMKKICMTKKSTKLNYKSEALITLPIKTCHTIWHSCLLPKS